MNESQLKTLNFLSIPLLLAMGFASWMGIVDEATYQRELPSLAAQGIGQDVVNLFVAGPILLLALIFMNRGSKTASWIFAGMVFYYLYSYIIYTFGIRHNNLFLVYCTTLALATYTLVLWAYFNSGSDIKSWFTKEPPRKATAIFLLAIAAMFYLIWLKDIVPPLLQGEAPEFVIRNKYTPNPVHAVDLSFALPGLIITAILLLKNHKLAYLLTPVLLVFIVILTLALVGMTVMVREKGLSDDISLVYIFAILTTIGVIVLLQFLKRLA